MVDHETAPAPVRTACLILALEALALVGAGGFLLFSSVFGNPNDLARALLGAVMAFAGAAALVAGARGLMRLSAGARTPMIVLQLLAIPVAYTLAFQADRVLYGGPILIAAVAVIYLLFTPPARAALEREPSD